MRNDGEQQIHQSIGSKAAYEDDYRRISLVEKKANKNEYHRHRSQRVRQIWEKYVEREKKNPEKSMEWKMWNKSSLINDSTAYE